jgi:hypothetical protein
MVATVGGGICKVAWVVLGIKLKKSTKCYLVNIFIYLRAKSESALNLRKGKKWLTAPTQHNQATIRNTVTLAIG